MSTEKTFGPMTQHVETTGLRQWLRLADPPRLSINALKRASLSVMEARYDSPNYGLTEMPANEDSFAVSLTLRAHPFHELCVDGRNRPFRDVITNDILFYDLSRVSQGYTLHPFHSLFFVIPRAFLDELAEDLGSMAIAGIGDGSPAPIKDPTLATMARSIMPYLRSHEDMSELQADHFMLAYSIYVCANYGNLLATRIRRGCLARWQERLAKELIEAHICGGLRLNQLAATCGLRTSQFAHAFRRTVGVAPYQWLSMRRIARAKRLLRGTRPLSDVALLCGFSDQSHLTRAFRRAVGVTPGYWRSEQ